MKVNPMVLIAVGGGVLIVGGLAVGRGSVAAEQTATDKLKPGGTSTPVFTGDIPTHTTDPELEKQQQTYAQLLTTYQQDLRVQQSLADDLRYRIGGIVRDAEGSLDGYSQRIKWHYYCNGFPVCGMNEWYGIDGTEKDPNRYAVAKTFLNGVGGLAADLIPSAPNTKAIQDNLIRFNEITHSIDFAYRQLIAARADIDAKGLELSQIQGRIDDLKKRIADLNAQGVF